MGHTKGNKGKEAEGSSHSRRNQDEECHDVPQLKKQRVSKKGEAPRKVKLTPNQRIRKMNAMEFVQTKWADHQLLTTLGIYDETRAIFANTGLGGLFNMENKAYRSPTQEFIATLTVYDDTELDLPDENRGHISFKINGVLYEMTMYQLGSLFNFPTNGEVYTFSLDKWEAQAVWTDIASGTFSNGLSKSGSIRHPAIRYAHKFLAHTLFARKETGYVKEDELALIIDGIKPYLVTTSAGTTIRGQPKPLNFAHYLVRRFIYYQEWVDTTTDKGPQINFGGLITPILRACGIQLVEGGLSIARIDAASLVSSTFLVGRIKNSYGYRFNLEKKTPKVIILPSAHSTSFNDRTNIFFRPPLFRLYDPARDGVFIRISKNVPTEHEEEEEDEQPQEVVYGSKRYDFEPFAEPVSGAALQAAHRHIGLLQRLTKWQGKQIKKLVKTVKKQGKMIKKLLNSPTKRREDAESSLAIVLSGPEGETSGARGRKGKAPISPSSSDSGNPCYSMDSSPSHSD